MEVSGPTGLTPARRRDDRLLDCALSPAGIPKAPWTAARCNRLLRPITSRLELIRKHNDSYGCHSAAGGPNTLATENNLEDPVATVKKRRHGYDTKSSTSATMPGTEPEWIFKEGVKKRCRHKYSVRNSQNVGLPVDGGDRLGTETGRPSWSGEVTVSTPTLVRACNATQQTRHIVDIIRQDTLPRGPLPALFPTLKPCHSRRPSHQSQCPPKRSLATNLAHLYDGLCDGYAAVLKACSSSTTVSNTRTRSLFSTCIRQIPNYIKEEARWIDGTMEAGLDYVSAHLNSNMSPDLYSELEMTLSCAEQGWKPLREVVKAHATSLLVDAILDGRLEEEMVTSLLERCVQQRALDEAQILLRAFITNYPVRGKPPFIDCALFYPTSSVTLNALDRFASVCHRRDLQFRELGYLLSSGVLAPEWLATCDFALLWERVLSSITEGDKDYIDAYYLLEAALAASFGLFADGGRKSLGHMRSGNNSGAAATNVLIALDHTIKSIIEVLVAIAILELGNRDASASTQSAKSIRRIHRLLNSLSIRVQRQLVLDKAFQWPNEVLHRVATTMLAKVLLAQSRAVGSEGDEREVSSLQDISILAHFTTLSEEMGHGLQNTEERPMDIFDRLGGTVCSIVFCCSRVKLEDTSEYMHRLLGSLVLLVENPSTAERITLREQAVLKRIISGALSRFVGHADEGTLPDWAISMQSRYKDEEAVYQAKGVVADTVEKRTVEGSETADAWEDDLCRQLAETPAISSRRRKYKYAPDSCGSEPESDLELGDFDFNRRPRDVAPKTGLPKLSQMLLGSSPAKPAQTKFSTVGRDLDGQSIVPGPVTKATHGWRGRIEGRRMEMRLRHVNLPDRSGPSQARRASENEAVDVKSRIAQPEKARLLDQHSRRVARPGKMLKDVTNIESALRRRGTGQPPGKERLKVGRSRRSNGSHGAAQLQSRARPAYEDDGSEDELG